MAMIRFLTFILPVILFISSQSMGQEAGVLRGFLTDSLSGEVLPYGNILIIELDEGTATDNQGYFLFPSLPTPAGYTISVSYVGYQSKEIQISLEKEESKLLNIQLSPVNIELQVIEKIDKRIDELKKPNISIHTFNIKELENIPQGVELDIIRSIRDLPGVTGSSDITASYNVRGGASNQNLVLLNDATIYNPFHALGMFSIIDPEMINSFDFYKGGFPNEYSGRISSVLNLISKYGNQNQYSGSASISLLTSKAIFEGPIPNGSFIITGRKSISNEVLKKFYNDNNVPVDFYDLSFNLNYANKLMSGARFLFHGFISSDKINSDTQLKANYLWRNEVYGIRYYQVLDIPLFYKLSFNVSNFKGNIDPKLSSIKPKQNEVRDLSFKADFTYVYPSKDILDVGVKINEIKTLLRLQNSFGEVSEIVPEGASLNWSVYGKYQLMRVDDLGIEIGTRFNIISLSKGRETGNPFEPRMRLTYLITPSIRLQASAGSFIQELTTLKDEDEVISTFEPWIILPEYIGVIRSTHYILGLNINVSKNWIIGTEGYFKKTQNLPLLNKEKIFPSDPDLITAESVAYGSEISNKIFLDNINITINYSLAWVFNETENIRYRPKYDTRHTLNFLVEINLGDGLAFSSAWTYKSGIPFTKLVGFYDKFYFDDTPNEFSILNMYERFTLLDEKNTGQTPDYHRLDLNLLKRFNFSFMKLTVGVNILNVYDRENLFYFDLETGDRVNMLPFLPSISLKAEF